MHTTCAHIEPTGCLIWLRHWASRLGAERCFVSLSGNDSTNQSIAAISPHEARRENLPMRRFRSATCTGTKADHSVEGLTGTCKEQWRVLRTFSETFGNRLPCH